MIELIDDEKIFMESPFVISGFNPYRNISFCT